MPKGLINKEKWSQNDKRFIVVLMLTVVYPMFASSFFAVVFFAIIPTIHSVQAAPHIYWLIVTVLWSLLCAVILPCFRDAEVSKRSIGMDFEQGPAYPTKVTAVQPNVTIEESDNKQRLSLLTNGSEESNESIEKAEKESLEKSKEDLGKSSASLDDKEKITQSGEFLNECIDSLGPENLQEEEADCEVHAEQENKDDQNKKDDITNVQDEVNSTKDDVKEKDKNEDVLQTDENKDKITQDDDDKIIQDDKENEEVDEPSEAVEPIIEQNEKIQTEAEPLQVVQGTILESEIPEEEEMKELEEDKDPVMRRKALPKIDTSQSGSYYECSMPTPKSAGSGRPESNVVFLFVNPDIASTEEDIIVNQQGDVQEKEKEN